MAKNLGGRPTLMDAQTIAKLEQAFSLDATILEACLFAGISDDVYYDYLKKEPKFADRVKALRSTPVLKARDAVISAFKKDPNLALKYLERKAKREFAPRTELTGADGKDLPVPILQNIAQPNAIPVHDSNIEDPKA